MSTKERNNLETPLIDDASHWVVESDYKGDRK
jgi:hypothetical protein